MSLEQKVRERAWHYLEPSVTACGGMTLSQLQQFVAGTFFPNPEQLQGLARRMQVK